MHRLSCSATTLLTLVLALSADAHAAPPQAFGDTPPAQPVVAEPVPAPEPAPRQFDTAADDGLLAAARGGSDLTSIDTTLSGTVSGNSASHVLTGSNVIQSGSFANMSGIPIIVQNTGANVLIQNATVINLQLK